MSFRNDLRTYRDEMKGIAILLVTFFHAQLSLSGSLFRFQQLCYGGVDIFFFLTGFGLYHSLSKPDGLKGYMRRRMHRLLPAYLPFCCLWLGVMLPRFHLGMVQSIRVISGNLFMIGFVTGTPKTINWYISALALTLMLAPVFYSILTTARKPVRTTLLTLIGMFSAGLCFIGDSNYMIVSRFPVFLLGMAAALPSLPEPHGPVKTIVGWMAFFVGVLVEILCQTRYPELLNDYAMYWHPFILIAPSLLMGLGWLFRRISKCVLLPLRCLGKASFEIFLFNAWAEVLGKQFGWASDTLSWGILTLGSIATGLAYHWIVQCVATWAANKRVHAHEASEV